jgi:hypothetical protein
LIPAPARRRSKRSASRPCARRRRLKIRPRRNVGSLRRLPQPRSQRKRLNPRQRRLLRYLPARRASRTRRQRMPLLPLLRRKTEIQENRSCPPVPVSLGRRPSLALLRLETGDPPLSRVVAVVVEVPGPVVAVVVALVAAAAMAPAVKAVVRAVVRAVVLVPTDPPASLQLPQRRRSLPRPA